MPPPSSATYRLFRDAILHAKRVACTYDGYAREVCPVIIGHTGDAEMVLAYQTSGGSGQGLPPGGAWKCFRLANVRAARLSDGPWREGDGHSQTQSCVHDVDLDIDIHVRRRR